MGFRRIEKPSPNCANPNKSTTSYDFKNLAETLPNQQRFLHTWTRQLPSEKEREARAAARRLLALIRSDLIWSRAFSWLTAFPFHLTRINYHSWPFRRRLRILPANGNLGRMFAPKMVPLLSLEYDYVRSFVYMFSFSYLVLLMHCFFLLGEVIRVR